MNALTLALRPLPGSNQWFFEATTASGVREAYVIGVWAVVLAAMVAYVESLR